jgi:hypothetical protein
MATARDIKEIFSVEGHLAQHAANIVSILPYISIPGYRLVWRWLELGRHVFGYQWKNLTKG